MKGMRFGKGGILGLLGRCQAYRQKRVHKLLDGVGGPANEEGGIESINTLQPLAVISREFITCRVVEARRAGSPIPEPDVVLLEFDGEKVTRLTKH